MDKKSGKPQKERPRFIKQEQIAIARLQTSGVICIEKFADFPQMGRFTLRDEGTSLPLLSGHRHGHVKARLHARLLMRFRVQIAPFPTLHECFFSRSIAWIGKKVITYYLKTPFFPISPNLAVSLSQRYATKFPCGVGRGRFCTEKPHSMKNLAFLA